MQEVVLVVDDEPDVVAVARDMLEVGGYRVLDADSAEHALQLSDKSPDPIDVLLTDLAMPGMNGRQLADQLSRVRPTIRVIYMSGLTGHDHELSRARRLPLRHQAVHLAEAHRQGGCCPRGASPGLVAADEALMDVIRRSRTAER